MLRGTMAPKLHDCAPGNDATSPTRRNDQVRLALSIRVYWAGSWATPRGRRPFIAGYYESSSMRTEVHVHGTIPLRPGTSLSQIETALQPWLDYLDVESLDELKSVHRDEPGLVYDARRRLLEICWTGDVGRNFRKVIEESLQALCRATEQATEIQLSYYHEDGRDEIGIVFVGPNAESIHEAQRQRMIEDLSNLLTRHFNQQEVSEVVNHVNELFSRTWEQGGEVGQVEVSTEATRGPRGRRHLH